MAKVFDSNSWKSVIEMIDLVNKQGSMLSGMTEDGEHIIYDVTNYGGDSDHDILHTRVGQHNGWIRNNYYDPETRIVEELYERG